MVIFSYQNMLIDHFYMLALTSQQAPPAKKTSSAMLLTYLSVATKFLAQLTLNLYEFMRMVPL